MYVILTSKHGHYRTEIGADLRPVEAYDYEFCGRVRARFVVAELLRESRMRIVDESEHASVNEVPTKFLQKFASADAARAELQSLCNFAGMDIRLLRRDDSLPSPPKAEVLVTFVPAGDKQTRAPADSNLLRLSLRVGGGIPFKCGAGLCGTCRCRIEGSEGALDAVKAKERKHLSEAELAEGWRMACQTFVRGDVRVHW